MTIQAWTTFSKHEEETPIVHVWIFLPRLPWHCFKKTFLIQLSKSFGKVLYVDITSFKRSTDGIGKIDMQIDLTKPTPRHVWIGLPPKDTLLESGKLWNMKMYPHIVNTVDIMGMILMIAKQKWEMRSIHKWRKNKVRIKSKIRSTIKQKNKKSYKGKIGNV